jgi:hypothetical protein
LLGCNCAPEFHAVGKGLCLMKAKAKDATENEDFPNLAAAIYANRKLTMIAKAVAVRLANFWPNIYPGVPRIAADCGMKERTVQKAIAELKRRKVIKTQRRWNDTSIYYFIDHEGQITGRVRRLGSDDDESSPPPPPSSPPPSERPSDSPAPGAGYYPAPGAGTSPAPGSGPDLHHVPITLDMNSRDLSLNARERGVAARPPRALRGGSLAPVVFHDLNGWDMPQTWRAEWVASGWKLSSLEERLADYAESVPFKTKNRDRHMRKVFRKWLIWESEDAAVQGGNAQRGAAFDSRRVGRGGGPPLEPTEGMKRYAVNHDLDLCSLLERFNRDPERRSRPDAKSYFVESWLKAAARVKAREKRKAA